MEGCSCGRCVFFSCFFSSFPFAHLTQLCRSLAATFSSPLTLTTALSVLWSFRVTGRRW
jgi:hypothetical protein